PAPFAYFSKRLHESLLDPVEGLVNDADGRQAEIANPLQVGRWIWRTVEGEALVNEAVQDDKIEVVQTQVLQLADLVRSTARLKQRQRLVVSRGVAGSCDFDLPAKPLQQADPG